MCLANVTDGQAEHLGDLLGHGAGVAVGRLGGGEDEVELGALDGGGEHLGRVERAGALERVVADEHGLGRAHGERGAQAGRLVVGRHRDEGDLAAARLVDELQGHLDAVGVGLVEDQLAVALQRVVGMSAPGSAGSGICLTQTAMFMARDAADRDRRRSPAKCE